MLNTVPGTYKALKKQVKIIVPSSHRFYNTERLMACPKGAQLVQSAGEYRASTRALTFSL